MNKRYILNKFIIDAYIEQLQDKQRDIIANVENVNSAITKIKFKIEFKDGRTLKMQTGKIELSDI